MMTTEGVHHHLLCRNCLIAVIDNTVVPVATAAAEQTKGLAVHSHEMRQSARHLYTVVLAVVKDQVQFLARTTPTACSNRYLGHPPPITT
jgi:hypothetical protein